MTFPKDCLLLLSYLTEGENGLYASYVASNKANMLRAIESLDTSLTIEPLFTPYIQLLEESKDARHNDSVRFSRFKRQIEKIEPKDLVTKGVDEKAIEQLEEKRDIVRRGAEEKARISDEKRLAVINELQRIRDKTHKETRTRTVYKRKEIEEYFELIYNYAGSFGINMKKAYKDFYDRLTPFNEKLIAMQQRYIDWKNELEDQNKSNSTEYEVCTEAINDVNTFFEKVREVVDAYFEDEDRETVTVEDFNKIIEEANSTFYEDMNDKENHLEPLNYLNEDDYYGRREPEAFEAIKGYQGTNFDKVDEETLDELIKLFLKYVSDVEEKQFKYSSEDTFDIKDYNPNIYGETFKEIIQNINNPQSFRIRQATIEIENNFPKEVVLLEKAKELLKASDDFSKAKQDLEKVYEELDKAKKNEVEVFSKQDEKVLEDLKEFLNGAQFSQKIKIKNGAYFEELKKYDSFVKEKLNIDPFRFSEDLEEKVKQIRKMKEEMLDILSQVKRYISKITGRSEAMIGVVKNAHRPLSYLRRAIREESSTEILKAKMAKYESYLESVDYIAHDRINELGGTPHRLSTTEYEKMRKGK